MKGKLKIISAVLFIGITLILSGCLKKNVASYKVNLEIWGMFDDSEVYGEIFKNYREVNPLVGEINYRKFTPDSYKKDLIDAMASGTGPDIFLISNNWVDYFSDKIEPAPNYFVTSQDVTRNFVDVVSGDFVRGGKVLGVPLSVNSLALFYNKDLFNAAGITAPPATWEEFSEDVSKLRRIDQYGNIVQAGAAIGTAYNVNRSTDLLSALMMQLGTKMTNDAQTQAAFDLPVVVGRNSNRTGEEALNFYTQFARTGSPVYTWNPRMHYSIDSFGEGVTAMMINYSWNIETVKNKNAKLNFGLAPLPQFSGKPPVNYANYFGYVVNKNKVVVSAGSQSTVPAVSNNLRIHEAWQLLKFMALKPAATFTLVEGQTGQTKEFPLSIDPGEEYLKRVQAPAARRDIIEKQKSDLTLGAFAYGNLIARNWLQVEPEASESIIAASIDGVNRGEVSLNDALQIAANRINQLMKKK